MNGRAAILAAALSGVAAGAFAQDHLFQPGNNPTSNQAWSAINAVPSDTANISPTRALENNSSTVCNIAVTTNGSAISVIYYAVQVAEFLPIQVIKIWSTNTTCVSILEHY
jgi:hypothetical protein